MRSSRTAAASSGSRSRCSSAAWCTTPSGMAWSGRAWNRRRVARWPRTCHRAPAALHRRRGRADHDPLGLRRSAPRRASRRGMVGGRVAGSLSPVGLILAAGGVWRAGRRERRARAADRDHSRAAW